MKVSKIDGCNCTRCTRPYAAPVFEALFLDFQIQQLAILKPVEVGKSYIPQKKAL